VAPAGLRIFGTLKGARLTAALLCQGCASQAQAAPLRWRDATRMLVSRSLEGIRAPAPGGVWKRMTGADCMKVKTTGNDWQSVNQDSSAAVLPRLSCDRNN
jgi:hypothetical protein